MNMNIIEEKLKINSNMNWYAVRTMNNRENKVKERLLKEIEVNNLSKVVGQVLIPTEKTITLRNGKKLHRDKIVYPGYIFLETSALGELERILKGIDGTSGFLRERTGVATPMRKSEIEKILKIQEETDNKDFSEIFTIGEEVEIIDGPFLSFKGKIEKNDEVKEKLTINVSIFGRPTPVDLTYTQVKKLN